MWATRPVEYDQGRPVDWGFGMTVCIAAYCHTSQNLILAADAMVTTVEMSADAAAVKILPVGLHWMTMYAGNDISSVTPILRRMDSSAANSLDAVTRGFQEAFAAELRLHAREVLAPLDYTLEQFKADGLQQLGSDAFSRLLYEVQQQVIDVEFLVAGFEKGDPFIFTVNNPGKIKHYSELGFWAIGSGQTAGIGSLFNQTFQIRFLPEEQAIYRVLEAKFNAENAAGVGRRTILVIVSPDGSRTAVKNEDIEELRPIWESTRTNIVPSAGIENVKKMLASAVTISKQSIVQTSEQEQ